ncbi:MAG TPA: hypothetical protein QF433_04335, partial [Candidatus Thalassarchaeaceae archaeon]|nr:hypothetical protein [Candidatus Thalassarchaeaceae archaeon]
PSTSVGPFHVVDTKRTLEPISGTSPASTMHAGCRLSPSRQRFNLDNNVNYGALQQIAKKM